MNPITRYARWLHTQWPAGKAEKLPVVADDGATNVPGLYITGDLRGIPLLKFAADSGARCVQTIASDPNFNARRTSPTDEVIDLLIIGGGVSGMAAAIEARKHDLRFTVIEADSAFSTIRDFPKAKPIFTYPTQMQPAGELTLTADIKEKLLEELQTQARAASIEPKAGRVMRVERERDALCSHLADDSAIRARRVIIAIGKTGNYRKLDAPGEDLDKVHFRLHDPTAFAKRDALVVGGGDSAVEAAVALAKSGARVTLAYRGPELVRPKPVNLEALQLMIDQGAVELRLNTNVVRITERDVVLRNKSGEEETIANDIVFATIGREPSLGLLRASGVTIAGDWTLRSYVSLALVLLICLLLFNWKAGGALTGYFQDHRLFPFNLNHPENPSSFIGTLRLSMLSPGFYYSALYCGVVAWFGVRRIRRRRTPYVRAQTITLTLIQWIPLFILPYLLLPWLGHNGAFDSGFGQWLGDQLFPVTQWDVHGREYWRAFGLVLAWPLFIWNVFTNDPLWMWLTISFAQTFIAIPLMIYFWGKGAYCGWICSCGALAETMGDAHRQKMPHGRAFNRLNMLGQAILGVALLLLVARVVGWAAPDSRVGALFTRAYWGGVSEARIGGWPVNYRWVVDMMLAGVLGVGLYFHFSGRTWCRFACPLAALMHVYTRLSRFRILADKKKCISCNICTTVCHQGIDVMNFAARGAPMEDPQCVRCSACVSSCPTGVLSFGQINPRTGEVLRVDKLAASPVQMLEVTINGHPTQ